MCNKKWTHPKFSGVVRNVGEKKWFPRKKAATKRGGAGAGGAQLLKALEGGESLKIYHQEMLGHSFAFFLHTSSAKLLKIDL